MPRSHQDVRAPYYILLTPNGGCFGEVPQKSTDRFAKYALDWTVGCKSRQEHEARVVEKEKARLIEEMKKIGEENAILAEVVSGTEKAKARLERENERLEAVKAVKAEEIRKLTKENSTLEEAVTNSEREKARLEKEQKRLEKENARLVEENARVRREMARLEEEKARLEEEKAEEIQRLKEEIKRLQGAVKNPNEEKARLEEGKARLEKENARLEKENAGLREEKAGLEKDKAAEISKIREENTKLAKAIQNQTPPFISEFKEYTVNQGGDNTCKYIAETNKISVAKLQRANPVMYGRERIAWSSTYTCIIPKD
jgi:chromosome segregation ATPase